MQTIIKLFLLAVIFSTAILPACKKYEEGPMISFRTKKGRLENTWKVEKWMLNGVEQNIAPYSGQTIQFTKEGNVTFAVGAFALTGTWKFINDKEDVEITFTGSTAPDDTIHIIKLKNKELWERETSGGITEEFHYIPN